LVSGLNAPAVRLNLADGIGCQTQVLRWRQCLDVGRKPSSWGKAVLMRNILCSMVLACALGGCVSSGNESIADATNASVAGQLVKGKTTQADVRRLYGDPIKTSFSSNGFETWEYEFTRLQSKPTNFIPYVNLVHSGAEGDKKALVIFFDKQKVLQDYTMSTSRIDMSRGIITR
jgi:hypothetical protein